MVSCPTNFIDISLTIEEKYTGNPTLVSILQEGDSTIDWRGMNFNLQNNNLHNHQLKIHLPIKLSDISIHNKQLIFNTYLWKKKGENFNVLDYSLRIRKGNPIIYGLFYPF
jgi:hypothetical protein